MIHSAITVTIIIRQVGSKYFVERSSAFSSRPTTASKIVLLNHLNPCVNYLLKLHTLTLCTADSDARHHYHMDLVHIMDKHTQRHNCVKLYGTVLSGGYRYPAKCGIAYTDL